MSVHLGALVAPMLSKLDLPHLLKVLDGSDAPTEHEAKHFELLLKILSAPVGGDAIWTKVVEFVREKGFEDIVLTYLKSGLAQRELVGHNPENLAEAKAAVEQLLTAIVENPNIQRLVAVVQCPECEFFFGATT